MAILRRVLLGGLLLLGLLVLAFAAGPRVTLPEHSREAVTVPDDVDAWLAQKEALVPNLVEGAEKRVIWADPAQKSQTALALVFIHGFSASPVELSPTLEQVAAALGANLFLTRLSGHGQDGETFGHSQAESWKDDVEEALAIGEKLGKQTILVGNSTGSTLAVWAAISHPELKALVLLSPNFGPKDPRSEYLLIPWGLQLTRLILGQERSWKPINDQQAKFWTHRYPVDVVLQMMALVKEVRALPLETIQVPTLMVYTRKDDVLDVSQIEKAFPRFGSSNKKLVDLPGGTQHMLGGDIVNPAGTAPLVAEILAFLQPK